MCKENKVSWNQASMCAAESHLSKLRSVHSQFFFQSILHQQGGTLSYYPGQKIETATHTKPQTRACSRRHAPVPQCALTSQFFLARVDLLLWPKHSDNANRAPVGTGAWSLGHARACSLARMAVSVFLARVLHLLRF